jgi:hypothetical protein
MKHIKLFEHFINEEQPKWHDSDAPDANGKFKELSPKDLAAWLIDTRDGDVQRISGALTQQIVFNRNEDPEYASKMEDTRKEVYKQLGREDLLEAYNINKYSPSSYAKLVASGGMSFEDAMKESGLPFTILMKLVKKYDKSFALSFEAEAKPGPDEYMTGLDKEEEEDKEDQIAKQRDMDDDDASAYKEMPGDEEAREKGKVKTSKHVKSYHELYGDKTDEELSDYEEDDVDYDKIYKKYKYRKRNESVVNEEKAEGDRGPIDNPDIEKALKKKEEETGVPIEFLRLVMRRGMAAWKTGHRPGAGQEQWGYARVNSFLTKQEGTWGGADSDIAKEVRDGGHDNKLKSA